MVSLTHPKQFTKNCKDTGSQDAFEGFLIISRLSTLKPGANLSTRIFMGSTRGFTDQRAPFHPRKLKNCCTY